VAAELWGSGFVDHEIRRRSIMRNARLHRLPLRLVTGAFILNSGLTKRSSHPAGAEQLHGFASGTYPFLKRMTPEQFAKALSTAEITLGSALLIPVIPAGLVGAALGVFSGGLLGLYLKTPGMRQDGTVRPTEQGIPLAKDVWMAGIAAALVLDDIGSRRSK
jgi:hypothetical protein